MTIILLMFIYAVLQPIRSYGDGSNDWKQYRFRQFYLDVSDLPATQTTTAERTRCYTDNTTAPNLPPNIINIPCIQTARYVIVETTYDAPEDNPQTGAMLEICEIEVYGCNPNCFNRVCDTSGHCNQGCVAGYWGDCSLECSDNCFKNVCNITGSCTEGCATGFYGNFCNKICSSCPEGCHRDTGECEGACPVGKSGTLCEKSCSVNCDRECDKNTGICQSCVAGKFGELCNKNCSTGCVSFCDRYNGRCSCKQGWQGETCECYAQQLSDPTTNQKTVLHGVVAILCISLVLNIVSFTWMFRNGICRSQNKKGSPLVTSHLLPHLCMIQWRTTLLTKN
ncbi:uncharacterized protein LOC144624171 isoform X2 [Crassostrea virginica]